MVKPSAIAAALAGVVGARPDTLRIQPIREDRYPKPKQGQEGRCFGASGRLLKAA